jgi:hypothetical protein
VFWFLPPPQVADAGRLAAPPWLPHSPEKHPQARCCTAAHFGISSFSQAAALSCSFQPSSLHMLLKARRMQLPAHCAAARLRQSKCGKVSMLPTGSGHPSWFCGQLHTLLACSGASTGATAARMTPRADLCRST